jgi:hypothetical protein
MFNYLARTASLVTIIAGTTRCVMESSVIFSGTRAMVRQLSSPSSVGRKFLCAKLLSPGELKPAFIHSKKPPYYASQDQSAFYYTPYAVRSPFRRVADLRPRIMFRSSITHTARSFFNKLRLSLSVGTSSRNCYNAMQRGILKPKSAPGRCSHIEISPGHHSYSNGCLTGVFLATTSYVMFDYCRTPESLI